jgi:hypothetical protein
MITLYQCKDFLEDQENVEGIEVCNDTYLRARFANALNPKAPHTLIVHPMTRDLMLRVFVPKIAKLCSANSELLGMLQDANYHLSAGRIGTDARDGEVVVEIVHLCQDGEVVDPSLDVFTRMIKAAMSIGRDVHLTAAQVAMVESGVPVDAAKQFVSQFCQRETDGDGQDML